MFRYKTILTLVEIELFRYKTISHCCRINIVGFVICRIIPHSYSFLSRTPVALTHTAKHVLSFLQSIRYFCAEGKGWQLREGEARRRIWDACPENLVLQVLFDLAMCILKKFVSQQFYTIQITTDRLKFLDSSLRSE